MKKNYKKIEIVFRSLEISGDVWIKQCKKPTPRANGICNQHNSFAK